MIPLGLIGIRLLSIQIFSSLQKRQTNKVLVVIVSAGTMRTN
jgi:hypothetical protein